MQDLPIKIAIFGSAKEPGCKLALAGLAECARPLIFRKIAKSAGIALALRADPTQRAATRAAAGFSPQSGAPAAA